MGISRADFRNFSFALFAKSEYNALINNSAPKSFAAYKAWLALVFAAIVTEIAAFFVMMRAKSSYSVALGVMVFALAILLANLIVSSHWLQRNPKTSAPKILHRTAHFLCWVSLIAALACGELGAPFVWAMPTLIGGLQ